VNGHGSESATALFDMAGFVVRAHVMEAGEWSLQVETTADRVGCAACGVRAVGHGRRRVEVRDLPIAGPASTAGVGETDLALRRRRLHDRDVERTRR